jgi:hypothetical protein
MLTILTGLAVVLDAGYGLAANQPLSDEQCQKIWITAVQSNDSLSAYGAAPYVVMFKQVDDDGDGKITNCAKGLVHEKSAST